MKLLKEIYDDIAKCNKCGFCQSVCPVFRETRKEGSVSRGRLALIRESVEGNISFDSDFKETLYECLLCKRCEAECPAGVESNEIFLKARAQFANNYIPLTQKLVFNHLLAHPNRLINGHRLLSIYQKTGLRTLLRKSGLIGLLGPLAKSEDFLPKIGSTFRDQITRLISNPTKETYRVGYFLGCGTNLLKPNEGIAAVNTLSERGCSVSVPEAFCCGLPAVSYGHIDVAEQLARKNLDILTEGQYDFITSDCASCLSAIKEYPKLFISNPTYLEKSEKISEKVVDYAQLLLKVDQKVKYVSEETIVTYHEPCHLGRGLNAAEEPRTLLKSIKGITFVEMAESNCCCGAAGSYQLTHPDLSNAVLRRKMDNIKATGAQVVVTSCPACVMQLEHGTRLFGVKVKIRHLSEIIAKVTKLDNNLLKKFI